jgi:ATP-dependent Lon protease
MSIEVEIPTSDGGEPVALGGPPGLPAALPVLPLRDSVTFPDTLTPLAIGQERSVRLINDVLAGNRMLVMVGSREPDLDAPGPGSCTRSGWPGSSRA